ncbi:hypothetical protein SLEP1_g49065 [Rubroshorea leprosula]|uniref:Uncharacterized protein n=1 Tax=Rubroshorea leprosula TaxID=152421 RepID=A0AAV5LWJ3_9ROSI|nr:hypothetical protein SLEP1_g49065 [Rubroshorea leprosula]
MTCSSQLLHSQIFPLQLFALSDPLDSYNTITDLVEITTMPFKIGTKRCLLLSFILSVSGFGFQYCFSSSFCNTEHTQRPFLLFQWRLPFSLSPPYLTLRFASECRDCSASIVCGSSIRFRALRVQILTAFSSQRSFSFSLTRGFSDSHHLPPSSKLDGPSVQHFIAQASLTASESQPPK